MPSLALRKNFWDAWPAATAAVGRIIRLRPVYVVDRSGTGGRMDPLLTADTSVVTSYPLAQRYPSAFYLPDQFFETSAPPPGVTPIYRGNQGSVYTKLLSDFSFQMEELLGSSWPDALDDTTRRLLSPGRVRPPHIPGGRKIRTDSHRELGYAWQLENADKYVERPFTVAGPNQTHTVSFATRAGGHITDWRVQMDNEGIDRQMIARRDYGLAIQSAMFWNEDNTGTPFVHNPTMAGDKFSDIPTSMAAFPVDDWEAQASPLLALDHRKLPDGSMRVQPICWPLDFNPDNHGGGLYQPVGWIGMKQAHTWTFNFNGRDGVHQLRNHLYMPFDIPFQFVAPQNLATWTVLMSLIPDAEGFDQVWIYDAATDTDTEAREGIEGPAYAGTDDGVNFQLTPTAWTGPGGPFTPHPMPSGIGGVIWRSTGTFWGPADDFAFGHFYAIAPPFTGKVAEHRQYSSFTYHAWYVNGEDTGKDSSNGERLFAESRAFGGLLQGWNTIVSYVCTGTYAQVKASMRQLYLDGLHDDFPKRSQIL